MMQWLRLLGRKIRYRRIVVGVDPAADGQAVVAVMGVHRRTGDLHVLSIETVRGDR